jgi:hypothetical protein
MSMFGQLAEYEYVTGTLDEKAKPKTPGSRNAVA